MAAIWAKVKNKTAAATAAVKSKFQGMLGYLKSMFWKQEMEITLVGLHNAGKSTLANVICSGHFVEDMIPTVGFNMRRVTKGKVNRLTPTALQRLMASSSR